MSGFFKDFHYYRPEEKRGIAVLLVIILVLIGVNTAVYYHSRQGDSPKTDDAVSEQKFTENYNNMVQKTQGDGKKSARRDNAPARSASATDEAVISLHPFDPNVADSAELRQMGLPAWMARNVVRYRNSGGHFRQPEDLLRIYGMDSVLYGRIESYIRISEEDKRPARDTASLLLPREPRKQSYTSDKFTRDTLIEINTADTALLKRIPGIGSAIARMITDYRSRLGGYYSIRQLRDINIDADRLQTWLYADSTRITKVPVGSTVSRLQRHPYISFSQARAIKEYRDSHGQLSSLRPLKLYEEFTEEDLNRISRYIEFD